MSVRAYRYSKLRWRVLVRIFDAVGERLVWLWRRFRPVPHVTEPRKFLLVQLDHMGDAVLSSPLIARLRAVYPDARIDVLASVSNRAIFEADPNLDRVHVSERNWFERRPDGWAMGSAVLGLGWKLRNERYDVGIDVRGDVLSVLVLALAGIPRRVGWAMGGGGFLLTDVTPWQPGRHEVRSRLALLEPLGLPAAEPPGVSVAISEADRAHIDLLLSRAWPRERERLAMCCILSQDGPTSRRAWPHRALALTSVSDECQLSSADHGGQAPPLVTIHMGAGTSAKRWLRESWFELIDRFLTEGWRVVLVGGRDTAENSMGLPRHENLQDWSGQLSVTETAAVIERSDLFLGADSGPAHLAAGVGTTAVVLFSGTNLWRQWRPWSRRVLVLRHPVPCRPCHRKICPLANHPCMTGLRPERVYRAACRWLGRSQGVRGFHASV